MTLGIHVFAFFLSGGGSYRGLGKEREKKGEGGKNKREATTGGFAGAMLF